MKLREAKVTKYNESPKLCGHCGSPINYDKKSNKFCSSSCAATVNNQKRNPRTEESRAKTSASLKHISKPKKCVYPPKPKACVECGSFHVRLGKTCSRICMLTRMSTQQSKRLADPEYRRIHQYGRGKQSWLERSFEAWLISFNITDYKTEEKFFSPELKKHYFVDFLFETRKLIIELDGTQHRNTIEQDKVRDEYLSTLGYNIVRISYADYQKQTRVNEIRQLLGLVVSETGLEPA